MRLGGQLLVVSMLLLGLPIAGVRWVQELESSFREQQVQVLNASLRAVAASLALQQRLPLLVNDIGSIYVQPASTPLHIDGYFEDWQTLGLTSRLYPGVYLPDHGVAVFAALHGEFLYLAFAVKASMVVYRDPQAGSQTIVDRVELITGHGFAESAQVYTITTEAPGPVVPRRVATDDPDIANRNSGVRESRIQGYWRDAPEGYHLELSVPLSLIAQDGDGLRHFGFRVVGSRPGAVISSWPDRPTEHWKPGVLIVPDPALASALTYALDAFPEPDLRLGVINNAGWQIATTDTESWSEPMPQQEPDQDSEQPFWLIRWIYRKMLSWRYLPPYQAYWLPGNWQGSPLAAALANQPVALWQQRGDRYQLLASRPLVREGQVVGALIAEQGSDGLLALVSHSFHWLFSLSLLVIIVVTAGLLGYASWLSLRIGRLKQATGRLFVEGGKDGLPRDFPVSRSADELGELSRSIAGMIDRQQEHVAYLRTLGGTFAHELQTPLAIVRSSLDNLSAQALTDNSLVYVQRAMAGADRLRAILHSLSEATRLDTMVAGADDFERVVLNTMVADIYQAYTTIYPTTRFRLELPSGPCTLAIIPELVVLAIDKLVANAVDFCADGGEVVIGLRRKNDTACLFVENEGAPLPDTMPGQLFDAMVSVRTVRDDKPHLGLGLYIARLVMERHGGRVTGRNRGDNSGVIFTLLFP